MKLNLTETGHISAEYPKTFYRVENWFSGRRIADFTSMAEAQRFAIMDSGKGRIDHKVSTMHVG